MYPIPGHTRRRSELLHRSTPIFELSNAPTKLDKKKIGPSRLPKRHYLRLAQFREIRYNIEFDSIDGAGQCNATDQQTRQQKIWE